MIKHLTLLFLFLLAINTAFGEVNTNDIFGKFTLKTPTTDTDSKNECAKELWILEDEKCIFLIADDQKADYCNVNKGSFTEIEDIPWDMIGTVGKRFHTTIESNILGQFQIVKHTNEVNIYNILTKSRVESTSIIKSKEELIVNKSSTEVKALSLPQMKTLKCRYIEN